MALSLIPCGQCLLSSRMKPALPCFCINLDERKEKWEATQAAFKGTGIEPRRFSAIRHAEGWKGCGMSHVAIAREAMRLGLPWVLVIEDDCQPSPDFAQRWPTVKDALWDERGSWDIFLGGPTYVQGPAQMHGKHLLEIGNGFALHFYVLQAVAYERAIAWNADRHGPIDVYYSNQFRIVTTQPFLALQRPSESDIQMGKRDYTYLFEESEEAIQKLTYALRTRELTVILMLISISIITAFWSKR